MSYRAGQQPHLGLCDHLSLILIFNPCICPNQENYSYHHKNCEKLVMMVIIIVESCLQGKQINRRFGRYSPPCCTVPPVGAVWLLFMESSSAISTILPHRLVGKLVYLGFPHATCMWIESFLSGCSQRVRVGPHTSTALNLSTGSPSGLYAEPPALHPQLHPHLPQ